MTIIRHSRRDLLQLGATTSISVAALGARSPVFADESDPLRDRIYALPLRAFDMYGPVANYARLRPIYFSARANGLAFERLYKAYNSKPEVWLGETCMAVGYGWWRNEKNAGARVKVAQIGQKFAQRFIEDYPKHPGGHMWQAVLIGVEALTQGILDALHLIPRYQQSLMELEARDPDYYYGFSKLLLAKILTKTPPRPLSVGDLDRALALLAEAESTQRGKVALWYLFYAETLFLTQGRKPALDILDAMENEVRPVDVSTAVMLEQSLSDAEHFRRVIHSGEYNKYTWDPVLVPARQSPKMNFEKYGITS